MRSTGASRPIEYIIPSSNSMSPAAGPSPSGAAFASRISKRAIVHFPCLFSLLRLLRPLSFVLSPALCPSRYAIILRRFERWFKQCDESILNCAGQSGHFWQCFVSQLGFAGCLGYDRAFRTTSFEVAMKTYRKAAVAFWLATIALLGGPNIVRPALAASPLGTSTPPTRTARFASPFAAAGFAATWYG